MAQFLPDLRGEFVSLVLGSIDGKADPAIVRAIRQLAEAVDRLEARLPAPGQTGAAPTVDPQARAEARLAQQQIQAIQGELQALAAQVAGLEP